MIPMTVQLDEKTAEFYARVAAIAERSLEQVLSDSLFKLAGELSLEAIAAKNGPTRPCGGPIRVVR